MTATGCARYLCSAGLLLELLQPCLATSLFLSFDACLRTLEERRDDDWTPHTWMTGCPDPLVVIAIQQLQFIPPNTGIHLQLALDRLMGIVKNRHPVARSIAHWLVLPVFHGFLVAHLDRRGVFVSR